MKNNIADLRNHLFDVIERLKDPSEDHPLDAKTAEAICLAAKRLIETAEVEIKFRRATGIESAASEFLNLSPIGSKPLPPRKRLSAVMDD